MGDDFRKNHVVQDVSYGDCLQERLLKVKNTEAVKQASKVNSREYMVIIYGRLTIDYLFKFLI